MTDPHLQIGIPVGFNGEKYLLFLLDSIEKTISRNFEYEYLIGINSREVVNMAIEALNVYTTEEL